MKHVIGYRRHYNLYPKWIITHFVQVFFLISKSCPEMIIATMSTVTWGIKHVPGLDKNCSCSFEVAVVVHGETDV